MALFGKEIYLVSEKRRDSRNRILQNGESQRKDGKYEFKYIDVNGTRRSAYSWKLVATDKVPEGKRCELSLREMEKLIRRDLEDGISTHTANSMTVNQLFDTYMSTKELKRLYIAFSATGSRAAVGSSRITTGLSL